MAQIQRSETNPPPRRMQRDPNRHYVSVQMDAPGVDYDTPYPQLMDMNSIVDPTQPMFRDESNSPRDTGSSKLQLISCSMEDYNAHMKQIHAESVRREVGHQRGGQGEETFERGAPLGQTIGSTLSF